MTPRLPIAEQVVSPDSQLHQPQPRFGSRSFLLDALPEFLFFPISASLKVRIVLMRAAVRGYGSNRFIQSDCSHENRTA
jgi:hypothetical protein